MEGAAGEARHTNTHHMSLGQSVDEVSLGAALLVLDELFQFPSPERPTLFRGYGTGVNDPLWRGVPFGVLFEARKP